MDFLSTMKAKAKADKKVIVLPESYEKRNLEAAAECLKEELADKVFEADAAISEKGEVEKPVRVIKTRKKAEKE